MALGKAPKEGDFGRSGVNLLNTREGDAGRQERDCEGVRAGSSSVTKGNAGPALECCDFPPALPEKSHFRLSAMHAFEENNLPALFSLGHRRPPC